MHKKQYEYEYEDKQTTLNQDHPPRIVRLIWLYYRLDLRLAVKHASSRSQRLPKIMNS